jgi:hypothetical protein
MNISIVMMEFEPTYFEEFLSYLAVKDLLVTSLCAVELRSKSCSPEESILITQAVDKLEKLLRDPEYQQLSMLMEASGWSREKLLAFLEETLTSLTHIESEDKYNEIYDGLLALLNQLDSRYKDLEEKVLSRYRARIPYV